METAPDRLESDVISRLMWRLMPFLFLLYIVAYLDRINVSFAVLQMRGQLGLSDRVIGRGVGTGSLPLLVLLFDARGFRGLRLAVTSIA